MEFSIIIFVGHGYSMNDETILECKPSRYDTEEIKEHELTCKGKRLIILDCCRRPEQNAIFGALNESMSYFASTERAISTRRAYEKLLGDCVPMNIIGYACEIGEIAGDSSLIGGYYSSSNSSIRKVSKQRYQKMQKNKYLGFPSVHEQAKVLVTEEEQNQHPQIKKTRGKVNYLPFVIKK